MDVKQVIVVRKDLKMRRGKEIAQGSHASIKWLVDRLNPTGNIFEARLTDVEMQWIEGAFKKVTLQVSSEEELLEVYKEAREAGLVVSLIKDAGLTEFDGVPTLTCLAIGPDLSSKIDEVTGHLDLY